MAERTEADRDPNADPMLAVDRRRPGRPEHVSESLLPLLRGEYRAEFADTAPEIRELLDEDDQMRPARGIAVAVVISGVLWAGIGYVVHRVLS